MWSSWIILDEVILDHSGSIHKKKEIYIRRGSFVLHSCWECKLVQPTIENSIEVP